MNIEIVCFLSGFHLGVVDRLLLVRIAFLSSVLILVCSRYYGLFFPITEPLFRSRPDEFSLPRLSWMGRSYVLARASLVVVCLLALFGLGGPLLLVLIVMLFAALDFYTANFTPKIWPNLFHLHVFGTLCVLGELAPVFSPSSPISFSCTTILLMRWQVGLIYFFAGVVKVIHGGIDWALKAKSLHFVVLTNGTRLGRFLLSDFRSRRAASIGALILELFLPFLLFFPSLYPLFAFLALSFHFATYGMFGISFWHLWVFFPALFLLP